MDPLLKWVGGKKRLLPTIKQYLPEKIDRYFEPFVGGGAAFFDFGWCCPMTYINDINTNLIHTYQAIKQDCHMVRTILMSMVGADYYELRDEFNIQPKIGLYRTAALMLALNYLGFNGLYRENKSGQFNVPAGKNSKGELHDLGQFPFDQMYHTSLALKNCNIDCMNIGSWIYYNWPNINEGSFVFVDPPYLGEFSDYNSSGFDAQDHRHLRDKLLPLTKNGATVMICGADNQSTLDIYGPPTFTQAVNRTVGASNRKKASEAFWVLKP